MVLPTQFESVLHAVREPLVVIDAERRIRFANEAFAELWSHEGELHRRDLLEVVDGTWDAAELAERLADADAAFTDLPVRRVAGGEEQTFLVNARVVPGIDPGPFRLLSFDNVTERMLVSKQAAELNAELEARVARRTGELERANAELAAFSYSVSHDLRAPLRAIDGFSRILVDEYAADLSPEAVRYLGLVRGGAQRMGYLIDGLLEFSRLDRQALASRVLDVRTLVDAVVAQHEAEIRERGVLVEVRDLPPVRADELLLQQVLDNLIGNALKYTRRVDRPWIAIRGESTGDRVAISVADNGVGFDMAYQPKIFEVFGRLHTADEYEGTGIGLALARRIVERHGGTLEAEGAPGAGATFTVMLERAA